MVRTGDMFDAVGNTQKILIFAHTTLSIEVNPQMEVTFVEGKVHCNKLSWLKVTPVNHYSSGKSYHFCCVTHSTWFLI